MHAKYAFPFIDCRRANTEPVFLNQVHAGRRPVHAWFLEISLVCASVCLSVCLSVCASTPKAINN